jgi:hypothetical protein
MPAARFILMTQKSRGNPAIRAERLAALSERILQIRDF